MNEEEKMEYCWDICVAAKRMKIKIQKHWEPGRVAFVFADYMTGEMIAGQIRDNEKDALVSACESLVKYLDASKVMPHEKA